MEMSTVPSEVPGECRLGHLIDTFLEFYDVYDSSCTSVDFSNTVLLLYGTNKSGVNTFHTRLKSSLSCNEFYGSIPSYNRDTGIFQGFHLHNRYNRLPKFDKIQNGWLVCGIYSLDEIRDTNKAIISILHKCLFKRVSKAKMLIVVDIRKLSIAASDIAESYYSELKDLFGEHFFDFLNYNCYFVLTHGDTVEDPQAIVNTIPGKVMELLSANNAGGAQFFHRLHSAHMIINYNVTTPEMILTKVTAWMADDKYMNPQKFAHDKIVATANIINRRCVEVLQERIEIESSSDFVDKVYLSLKDDENQYTMRKKLLKSEIMLVDMAIKVKSSCIDQVIFSEALDDIQRTISDSLENLNAMELCSIGSYRFQSVEKHLYSLGRHSVSYQMCTTIKLTCTDYGIIVCSNSEVLDIIHKKLAESDSIAWLSTETSSHILFNSLKCTEAADSRINISRSLDSFSINIELSEPFEVLLAYPMTLSTSPALVRFRDVQDRKLRKASDDLMKATDELNTLNNDKNNKSAALNRLRAAREDFETKLNELRNQLKEMATTYSGQLLENQAKVESKLRYLRNVKNGGDALINNMNILTRILKSNELDYSLNDYMREYEILIDTKISAVETVLMSIWQKLELHRSADHEG